MKKISLMALLLSSASWSALADPICTGQSPAQNGNPTPFGANLFVKARFVHYCSANVYLDAAQSALVMGVGSASGKGGKIFANSSGSGVMATGSCAASGCTQSDTAAAAADALASAGSS